MIAKRWRAQLVLLPHGEATVVFGLKLACVCGFMHDKVVMLATSPLPTHPLASTVNPAVVVTQLSGDMICAGCGTRSVLALNSHEPVARAARGALGDAQLLAAAQHMHATDTREVVLSDWRDL